jgi:hypothetical protein
VGTLLVHAVPRLALYLLVLWFAAFASSHARADHTSNQMPGYDISWPQCGKAYPSPPIAFAIIGLNNGRPYTANPCFLDEYNWARKFEPNPAVYINTDFPKPGRVEGNTGPFGACEPTDDWCRAYNYGYGIGRDVTTKAASLGIAPKMWWLDVETGNYWLPSEYSYYNAQVVKGTIEFFTEHHLPVGIYGTPRQWRLIAGTYAPGLPVWTAGAQGIAGAASRCNDPAYAFAGGTVALVQYYDYDFDTNY